MIAVLNCVVIALFTCIIYQYHSKKVRDKDLIYITIKLELMTRSRSSEQILIVSGDKQLI